MIRQQAFENPGRKMLKGALHCHTTRSDGQLTPEELLKKYHEHGYNFVAITDHRIYNYKNFAPDLPVTVIPGMEADVTFHQASSAFRRCYHTVCLGPAKENGNGFEQDEIVLVPKEVYSEKDGPQPEVIEGYQKFLDSVHEKNNLTIYCHPEWSATPARFFDRQEGNAAMEIWNTSSYICNDADTNAAYWDDVLGLGKVIYGVATDDGHGIRDCCGGWVMVNAENSIPSILDALQNGAFYSSCGPEIHDFYLRDDGYLMIECSPVIKVNLYCDGCQPLVIRAEKKDITCTCFRVDGYDYVRLSIEDAEGRRAWTNPIFLNRKKFGLEY
ncbi:MAG: hypothetical protein IJ325_03715 [Clostridia bacterium]|nr:hypothetical protein [Clostridia bacterium]